MGLDSQYLVYQPHALINASTLRGMLSTRRSNTSSPMLHHISANHCQSTFLTTAGPPRRVFVSGYLQWNSVLRCAQRFSIRFISGEIASQFITENPCSLVAASSQSPVFLDT